MLDREVCVLSLTLSKHLPEPNSNSTQSSNFVSHKYKAALIIIIIQVGQSIADFM